MAKAFTAFAAAYFGLVLLKNGTIPKLANDAARGAGTLAGGLKNITTLA